MERMNFTTLLSKYDSIVIPKIQRDYAQGRLDKKSSAVRNNLLNDIFSGKVIDFDFIFGTKNTNHSVSINGLFGFDSVTFSKSKKDFIPLDGQQRLTTLFLLYLYEAKSKHLDTRQLSKFTYDTRHAAKDFCKAVVDADWNTERKPSESITNSNWFMDYWQYDPTVEGMLTMLDAIHEKAKSGDYPDLDKISFYFFDMDEHGLNESLYLKMNSRGKPLTAFENLKADIDSILPLDLSAAPFACLKDNRNAGNSFSDKWKFYVDRDWTDFFWNYKDENNLIDSAFVRFIANTLACYWAVNKKQDDGKEEPIEQVSNSAVFSQLINLKGNEDFIDFSIFKSALTLDNNAFVFLARTLSIFAKFKQSIDANSNSAWKRCDEPSLIEKICKGDVTYAVRAVFFAVASYPGLDFDSDAYRHWMRVIWNIIENANLNGVSELRLIHNLSSEISQKDIYEALTTYKIEENSFAKEQVVEEVAKVNQILNGKTRSDGKTWEEIIIEAEKYAFFKGAIRFLFLDGAGGVDWDKFDEKYKKAQMYFKEKSEPDQSAMNRDFDNAKLLKALISRFTSENFWGVLWWHYRVFNNFNSTWRYYLLNKNIYAPIHEIMMGENNIKEKKGNQDDDAQNRLYQLSNTNLLDYVIEKIPYSWIRNYHNHIAIFPSAEGIFLNSEKRDKLLYELYDKKLIELSEDSIVPNTQFLFGTNIKFKYKQKFFFQWWGNPIGTQLDIYLMKDEWSGHEERESPTHDKNNDEDFYYCFKVTPGMEKNTKLFTDELDRRIDEALNKN